MQLIPIGTTVNFCRLQVTSCRLDNPARVESGHMSSHPIELEFQARILVVHNDHILSNKWIVKSTNEHMLNCFVILSRYRLRHTPVCVNCVILSMR
jgi:hypothetical protein